MNWKTPISSSGELQPGDHLSVLFRTPVEQKNALNALLANENRESRRILNISELPETVWSADSPAPSGSNRDNVDTNTFLTTRKIGDLLSPLSAFTPNTVIDNLIRERDAALAAGYSSLWVVQDMESIVSSSSPAVVIEYEIRLNHFLSQGRCLLICLYNMELFSPRIVRKVLETHSHLYFERELHRNPFYIHTQESPDDFSDKQALDTMLQTLQTQKLFQNALKNSEKKLKIALRESRKKEREIASLLNASRAVMEKPSFADTARTVFDICKQIINARAGYISLLSDNEKECEVVFRDCGRERCQVNHSGPVPIRGFRAEVLHTNRPLFCNNIEDDGYNALLPQGHMPLHSVMIIPLRVGDHIEGLLGLANKPRGFTEYDLRLGEAFAELLSVALRNSRDRDALRSSEEHIRLLLTSTAGAVYGIDLEGNCTFCNKSCLRMLGYKSENELLGKNMHHLVHHSREDGSPYPVGDCLIFRAVRAGENTHVENEVLWRADGSSFAAEYWSFPLHDNGKIVGAVITFLDITKRKRAEIDREILNDRLRKKNQELKQVLYCISHDLRTPLLNVRGFSDDALKMLYRSAGEDNRPEESSIPRRELEKNLHFIQESAFRLDSMLNSLLHLTRFDHASLHPAPLNMNILIQDILKTFEYQIRQKKITIELANLPQCHSDILLLNHVFANLLSNAIKYLDPQRPGKITISGRNEGKKVEYSIADNGIGINPGLQERIFEVFFRIESINIEGDGMGLAITRRILERLDGEIRVESGEDRGSIFRVYLPAPVQ